MVNVFHVKIALPNKASIDRDCVSVNMPTALGYITVLHDHSPIIGAVTPGYLTITFDNNTKFTGLINYGVFQFEKNKLVILTDFFEKEDNVSLDAIQAIKTKLNQALESEQVLDRTTRSINSFTKIITAKASENKKN